MVKTYCFSPLCDVEVGDVVDLYTTLQWLVAVHYDHIDFALDSKYICCRLF